MSGRQALAVCPRCGKVHRVNWGVPEVKCDCHLYCSSGDKPSDCSVTEYNYTGQLGWPVGAHLNRENEGDDVLHRTFYCSTHNKYIYKEPIWLEVDYKRFERERLPKKLRMLKSA